MSRIAAARAALWVGLGGTGLVRGKRGWIYWVLHWWSLELSAVADELNVLLPPPSAHTCSVAVFAFPDTTIVCAGRFTTQSFDI